MMIPVQGTSKQHKIATTRKHIKSNQQENNNNSNSNSKGALTKKSYRVRKRLIKDKTEVTHSDYCLSH